jgi:hypothetical protein
MPEAEPKPVLSPLRVEDVRSSIAGSFANLYLTLLSIIQGVALADWAGAAIPGTTRRWEALLRPEGIDDLGFRLATLLAIVVVWHAYFWLAIIARWVPSIWDSLLLFAIGVVEFAAIRNLRGTEWFFAMGLLGVLGGFAYVFNIRELGRKDYAPDHNSQQLARHILRYKEIRGKRLLALSLSFLLASTGVFLGKGRWDLVPLVLAFGPPIWLFIHVSRRHERYEREWGKKVGRWPITAVGCGFVLVTLGVHLWTTAWTRNWLLLTVGTIQAWLIVEHVLRRRETLAVLASAESPEGPAEHS